VLIDSDAVRFRTRKAGVLIVARDGEALTLDLPVTRVAPQPHPELLSALGLDGAEVYQSVTGAEATAIILVEDEAAVRACQPDMRALRGIALMAIVTAPASTGHDVVSRVFVPAWGVDEDPVTGSAHAALAPFWAERLGRDRFTAFQASARGGRVAVRLAGERAILGGRCVTVIEGAFRI
jgi:predicted PhzF superfamily epimerase YddE/YHI9